MCGGVYIREVMRYIECVHSLASTSDTHCDNVPYIQYDCTHVKNDATHQLLYRSGRVSDVQYRLQSSVQYGLYTTQ